MGKIDNARILVAAYLHDIGFAKGFRGRLLLQANDIDDHVGVLEFGSVLSTHPFIH